jgi:hypothetical protein
VEAGEGERAAVPPQYRAAPGDERARALANHLETMGCPLPEDADDIAAADLIELMLSSYLSPDNGRETLREILSEPDILDVEQEGMPALSGRQVGTDTGSEADFSRSSAEKDSDSERRHNAQGINPAAEWMPDAFAPNIHMNVFRGEAYAYDLPDELETVPYSIEDTLAIEVTRWRAAVIYIKPIWQRLKDEHGAETAARLIGYLEVALHEIMPVWGPSTTWSYVRDMHWMGYEDERERREEVRHDLAHTQDCEPEDVPDNLIEEALSEYVVTYDYVADHIPEAFRPWNPTVEDLREALEERPESLSPLTRAVLRVASACNAYGEEAASHHPVSHSIGYQYEHMMPFALLFDIEDGADTTGPTLSVELFDEEAQHGFQSGHAEGPITHFFVCPSDPDSLAAFTSYMESLRRGLALAHLLIGLIATEPLSYDHTGEPEQTRSHAATPAPLLPERFVQALEDDLGAASKAVHHLTRRGARADSLPGRAVPAIV